MASEGFGLGISVIPDKSNVPTCPPFALTSEPITTPLDIVALSESSLSNVTITPALTFPYFDILKYHFTATFTTESITRVLDLIRFSTLLDYDINGTDVYISHGKRR